MRKNISARIPVKYGLQMEEYLMKCCLSLMITCSLIHIDLPGYSQQKISVYMKTMYLLAMMLLLGFSKNFAATVDTINIPSKVMNKDYKAVIVLPSTYSSGTKA